MSILDRFEQRVSRLISGAFSKVGSAEVEPVEIAAALTHEITDRAVIVGQGRTVVPNDFTVYLSTPDFQRLNTFSSALLTEFASVIREQVAEQRYLTLGTVEVRFELAEDLEEGLFRIDAEVKEEFGQQTNWTDAATHRGPRVSIDGFVHTLTLQRTTFGRGSDADIKIEDPGASRHHCEIRLTNPPRLVDLGSTNGTWVRGQRVSEVELTGDVDFTIGNTVIQFRLR